MFPFVSEWVELLNKKELSGFGVKAITFGGPAEILPNRALYDYAQMKGELRGSYEGVISKSHWKKATC